MAENNTLTRSCSFPNPNSQPLKISKVFKNTSFCKPSSLRKEEPIVYVEPNEQNIIDIFEKSYSSSSSSQSPTNTISDSNDSFNKRNKSNKNNEHQKSFEIKSDFDKYLNYSKNFNTYSNKNEINMIEDDSSSDDNDIDIINLINGFEDNCIVDGDEHVAYDDIEYEHSNSCNPCDYL